MERNMLIAILMMSYVIGMIVAWGGAIVAIWIRDKIRDRKER